MSVAQLLRGKPSIQKVFGISPFRILPASLVSFHRQRQTILVSFKQNKIAKRMLNGRDF